jgi:hypothetical protein
MAKQSDECAALNDCTNEYHQRHKISKNASQNTVPSRLELSRGFKALIFGLKEELDFEMS